jgi:hypothetical protein
MSSQLKPSPQRKRLCRLSLEVLAQAGRHTRKRKSPAASSATGLSKLQFTSSEHAKHDGADKGEGDIRGDYIQPIDQGHRNAPWD